MAEIVVDDEDELLYPTAATGELSISWCEPRRLCSAQMSRCFALPAHHETLPTLRQQFLQLAHRCGCTDLDAAAIRNTKRELTQPISAWIYKLRKPDTQPVSGIQYQSRHGDQLTLWAIYERDLTDSPPQITNHADKAVTPDDADLVEALRIPHRPD